MRPVDAGAMPGRWVERVLVIEETIQSYHAEKARKQMEKARGG